MFLGKNSLYRWRNGLGPIVLFIVLMIKLDIFILIRSRHLVIGFFTYIHQVEKNHFISSQTAGNQGGVTIIDDDNDDDKTEEDKVTGSTEQCIQNITDQNLKMGDPTELDGLGDAIENGCLTFLILPQNDRLTDGWTIGHPY